MEVLKQLPKINMNDSETGCCPRFQPEIYDEKLFELDGLDMVIAKTRSTLLCQFVFIPSASDVFIPG